MDVDVGQLGCGDVITVDLDVIIFCNDNSYSNPNTVSAT